MANDVCHALIASAASRMGMLRRGFLATLSLALAAPIRSFASDKVDVPWRTAVKKYLASCADPNGGYRWHPRGRAHLTTTFGAIGCFHVMGEDAPDKEKLAAFVRKAHPANLKKLEQEHRIFDYEQIQSLVWLGEDVSGFRKKVAGWTKPVDYMKRYEQHGYPVFQSEAAAILCRELVGITEPPPEAFVEYFRSRQRANGSFNSTPAADGSDGNVLNTWWGLRAFEFLRQPVTYKTALIEWLRKCQLPGGGFTHSLSPELGGVDDVAYTWAAIGSLKLLVAQPADREKCVVYLRSLWNSDGGFADRPGWESNPLATFRALESLLRLTALDTLEKPPSQRKSQPAIPEDLKVFSIQLEAHGQGSPADAVELARSLKIHLWGAKNAKPGWIERAQQLADEAKVPVTFFPSNEEYGTWLTFPGHGAYSHMIDVAAPPGADFGKPLANDAPADWKDFRAKRLAPLWNAKGILLWQFGENEPLASMVLDESLKHGGYAAISTFHFGNPDFTNSEPFLQRYRGKIPFVALQDAHGPEPWWFSDMTTGFRTLFVAREPTWEAWLEALRLNRVVAVRHDSVSNNETWMHGTDAAIDFVTRRELDWRWWDNPDIQRPMISMVVVRAGDEFDLVAPKTGMGVRIRTAWTNSTQGLLKEPLAEVKEILFDDKKVESANFGSSKSVGSISHGSMPVDVAFRLTSPIEIDSSGQDHLSSSTPRHTQVRVSSEGRQLDNYIFLWVPELKPGKHTVTATTKVLATGEMVSRTIEFEVK